MSINKVAKYCYYRSFLIDPALTGGVEDVRLYAEVHDQPQYPEDGKYYLELWLGAGNYGIRNFVVGYGFGKTELSETEIDLEVQELVAGQTDNGLQIALKTLLQICDFMNNPHIPGKEQ